MARRDVLGRRSGDQVGKCDLLKVATQDQRADVFTKYLPAPVFRQAVQRLGMRRVLAAATKGTQGHGEDEADE